MPLSIARSCFLLLCICLVASAALNDHPKRRPSYVIKETHHVPRGWTQIGPAPALLAIRLQIGLKQSRFNELERQLYEVSDPTHIRYGQHLTKNEVNQLIRPTNETIIQVHAWLLDSNISQSRLEYSPAKDWISVTLPIESAERLLDTKYSVFKHDDRSQVVRTLQWSLPTHLLDHIETIQPTTSFFRPKSKRSTLKGVRLDDHSGQSEIAALVPPGTGTVSHACNATAVTNLCLRTLYGTVGYTLQSASNNSIGLTNYLGEVNNRSDVFLFLNKYRPEASAAAFNFTVEVIAKGDDRQTPENSTELKAGKDLEGNLDAETILGMTWPTPLTAYNTGGQPQFIPDKLTVNDTNEPYLTWLQYILAQPDIPSVMSTSYGDDEQTIPYSYATAVCNGFAQLGARGISVLFASGDNGVGPSADCFTNDGKNTTTFLPIFPGGCPYVTAVGATMKMNPEVVAHNPKNNFTSGGGFSNYFARPSYQDSVVTSYINSLNGQFHGLFNTSGRGYPDIAAQGFHFLTIWNGTSVSLDGTSAATPTAASVIALVNDALLAAGKPVLGFLNPWIYSMANQSFTDVTSGSSIGCNTSGFPAAEGWDAVTGWGTPYFPNLKKVALGGGVSVGSRTNLCTTWLVAVVVLLLVL